MFLKRLRLTLEMIKFEHSVFALPFALTGALLAVARERFRRPRHAGQSVLDRRRHGGRTLRRHGVQPPRRREIDAPEPANEDPPHPGRTANPNLLHGASQSPPALLFLFAAWELNPLCFRLAPIALAVVLFYSFTKRFTHLSHIVLGFALGIAPAAAWIAVRGSLDPRILWLTAAVTFWTAGFDIIYSCQDYEFDNALQLSACPAGAASAMR